MVAPTAGRSPGGAPLGMVGSQPTPTRACVWASGKVLVSRSLMDEMMSCSRILPRANPRIRVSIWQLLARAAHLARQVLELGQAVLHRQHGLGVVHMDLGEECELRDDRDVDVEEVPAR